MLICLTENGGQEKKQSHFILQNFFFVKGLKMLFHVKHVIPADVLHPDNHPNVTMIRPDGQDIKKEQMSALIFKMTKKGYEAGRKIYIISTADRMNVAAANTLLKFLEEPEGEVTAILLTDSYQSILPTIQSRCQRISFLPPSREMMIEKLVEQGITTSMAATVTMVTADLEEAFQLANDDAICTHAKNSVKIG